MTLLEQRKIEFLAEKDGWTHCQCGNPECGAVFDDKKEAHLGFKDYLHSRDALQPILENLTDGQWHGLTKFLYDKYPVTMSLSVVKPLLSMPAPQLATVLCEVLGFDKDKE